MIDKLKTLIGKWIFSKALKKAVKKVVTLIIAKVIAINLEQAGIEIDMVQFENFLTVTIFGFIEIARNYIKVRFKVDWL